jgi:predicted metal-binding membrane protein
MGFLLTEWREGIYGAFRMGLKHGGDCLGCCWAQMLIMFAVGVMSLTGMALITLLVCMEKILPVNQNILSKGIGILFILWSIWLF